MYNMQWCLRQLWIVNGGLSLQWLIWWQSFAKFCSYKSDFDLDMYKGFIIETNGPIFLDFERKKEKFPDMYNRF